jgi:hypothetical protein
VILIDEAELEKIPEAEITQNNCEDVVVQLCS